MDSPGQDDDVDDDEEQLVRQVIAENPVQERGVRDEWAERVGWHRREDVLLLHAAADGGGLRGRGATVRQAAAAPQHPSQQRQQRDARIDEADRDFGSLSNSDFQAGTQDTDTRWMDFVARKGLLWVVAFGTVLLILRLSGFRSCSRKKRRAVRTI